jgi:hypothetical protein
MEKKKKFRTISAKPLRNDGTDRTKFDPKDNVVMATDRTCFIQIKNELSSTITEVSLTHTSGDNNNLLSAASLAKDELSIKKQISYETGWWADFDYWNISFKIGSTTYDTQYNDRCNIEYPDAGKTIVCRIQEDSVYGGDHNLKVDMPKSSSCDFGIYKNS